MSQSITVLSWNVHFPTFGKDCSYVVELLKDKHPDVICLQEYVGGRDGLVKEWLETNDYSSEYLPFAFNREQTFSQGLMVAVKNNLKPHIGPVGLRDTEPRFMRNFRNKRGLLDATIQIGKTTLSIMDIHLTVPRPWTADLRNEEYKKLVEYLNTKKTSPWLLVGDFNFNIYDAKRTELLGKYQYFTGNSRRKTWSWRGWRTPIAANIDAAIWNGEKIRVKGELGRLVGYDHRPLLITVSAGI